MNASLAQATANECDLKAQIQALQRSLHDASMSSAAHSDKYKQVKLLFLATIYVIIISFLRIQFVIILIVIKCIHVYLVLYIYFFSCKEHYTIVKMKKKLLWSV